MAKTEKLEFCSAAWVAHAGEYLHRVVAETKADLTHANVAFNEVFTGAPPHLEPDDEGRIGWYLRIADGRLEVARGVLVEADFRIVGDYNTVVPLARMVFAGNPDLAAEAARLGAAAAKAGKIRREGDGRALAALDWMAGLHDEMAVRTA